MGTGALSPWLRKPGLEADHSPPYCVQVKNGGAIPLLPHTSSRGGAGTSSLLLLTVITTIIIIIIIIIKIIHF
jgi:hypothetical protein